MASGVTNESSLNDNTWVEFVRVSEKNEYIKSRKH